MIIEKIPISPEMTSVAVCVEYEHPKNNALICIFFREKVTYMGVLKVITSVNSTSFRTNKRAY